MNINLHIERLILEGLPVESQQRAQVQAAVAVELMRLLTAHGLRAELVAGSAVPSLPTEGIQLAHDYDPAQLGVQIAQACYGEIGDEITIKER